MAIPKKAKRVSIAGSSKTSADQAAPRGSAGPAPLKPTKTTAAPRKPAAKKRVPKKTPPVKASAKNAVALADDGAKPILKELRAIRETLARHSEMLAQISECLATPESPARDRGRAEARTNDSDTGQDTQDEESGELP